ncbi:MAG: S8 family peptidase [Promethearchaeota archaeon]
MSPELQNMIKNANPDDKFDVIVCTLPTEIQRISRSKNSAHHIQDVYELIPAFNGILDRRGLEELARNPGIVQIQPNLPVFEMLDTVREAVGVDDVYYNLGINGSGVRIAVIDSGIDAEHVDLQGKVAAAGWKDFINDEVEAYDDRGHGTHVAGIIAGQGNQDSKYRGIAPGAELLIAKILDKNGQGTLSDVIAGIEWAVKNDADIINLSLGTSVTGDGTTATDMAVNRAVELGCTVIVAAGNFGANGSRTIGIPGTAASAITVGGVVEPAESSTGNWEIYEKSSRGPTLDGRIKPDICAPGKSIWSAWASIYAGDIYRYRKDEGTSMSTAVVSGIAALMLQRNYSLSPTDIKNILTSTAKPIDPEESTPNNDYGYGVVNASTAVILAGDQGIIGLSPSIDLITPSTSSIYNFGEEVLFNVTVNLGDDPNIRLLLHLPAGVEINLTDSITGDFAKYLWNATTVGTIEARVSCKDSNGRGKEKYVHFYVRSSKDVLIIDDSLWGEPLATYYRDTLDNCFYSHLTWDVRELGTPNLATIAQDNAMIIWLTGSDDENTLTEEEQVELMNYLNNDGKLLLVGQDIAFNLNESDSFLTNVLHANFEADESPTPFVEGKSGDPIFENLKFQIIGGDGASPLGVFSSPDAILPLDNAVAFLTYEDGTAAGIRFPDGDPKFIYLPFSFAAINSQNSRNELLSKSIYMLTDNTPPHAPPQASIITPSYGETLVGDQEALIVVDATPHPNISSIEYKIYNQTTIYQDWTDISTSWNTSHYELNWPIPNFNFPIPSIVDILVRVTDVDGAFTTTFSRVYIKEGNLLVINADRKSSYPDNFVNSLRASESLDIWQRELKGTINLELMNIYDAIVWKTGKDSNEGTYRLFTDLEVELLSQYLKNGGNLLVSGEYIALSYADSYLLASTLGVVYRGTTSVGTTTFSGASNNFLDGEIFDIANSNALTIDYTDTSAPLIIFDHEGQELSIAVTSGRITTGRSIFLAFDPSDITSSAQRTVLANRCLQFLTGNLPYCEITSPEPREVYNDTNQLTVDVSLYLPESTTSLSEILVSLNDQEPTTMTQGNNVSSYSKTLSLSAVNGIINVKVVIRDQLGNTYLANTRIYIKANDFILVDDDGKSFWENYYTTALKSSRDLKTDHWDVLLLGKIPSTLLKDYPYCIWFTGSLEKSDSISEYEYEIISSYLTNGGKLFISGEGIENETTLELFKATLKATTTTKRTVYGNSTSPVIPRTLELDDQDSAKNTQKPTIIEPLDSSVISLAFYNEDETETAGIGFRNSSYALVFFAFNFEALGAANDRADVLNRIIKFLDGTLKPSKTEDDQGTFIVFGMIVLFLIPTVFFIWRESRKKNKISKNNEKSNAFLRSNE